MRQRGRGDHERQRYQEVAHEEMRTTGKSDGTVSCPHSGAELHHVGSWAQKMLDFASFHAWLGLISIILFEKATNQPRENDGEPDLSPSSAAAFTCPRSKKFKTIGDVSSWSYAINQLESNGMLDQLDTIET